MSHVMCQKVLIGFEFVKFKGKFFSSFIVHFLYKVVKLVSGVYHINGACVEGKQNRHIIQFFL